MNSLLVHGKATHYFISLLKILFFNFLMLLAVFLPCISFLPS